MIFNRISLKHEILVRFREGINMTSKNRGKYASKHPEGTELEPSIANQIQIHQDDGRLACAAAIKIAGDLGVSLSEVGRNADLMDLRIDRCILGLFGYKHHEGKKRLVKPAESVPPEMEKPIKDSLEDDRLSCKAAWDIADQLEMSRPSIAEACEALKIKISNCQLGAF